ncbi:MAG TPA: phosphatidate cytidylyltransferase [Bacteroidia bacterium]|nr:phosphatidate cytidylyltransferase [Bacteroidia bacterium]
MSNFWQRTITGILFITVLIGSILYGQISFQVLFLVISLLGLDEFYKLIKTEQREPNVNLGLFAGAVTYILASGVCFDSLPPSYLSIIYPLFGIIFFAELYRKKQDPFGNIAITILGIVYAVIPFVLLNKVASLHINYNSNIVIGYFVLQWSSDTFAYLVGMSLGKRRLFERISPKKSWEGFIGALILTTAASQILAHFYTEFSSIDWAVIALIVVITGTLGDLVESLMKRSLNIKDSGNILPGHGGILDRFDGLLLAIPFIWAYLEIFN